MLSTDVFLASTITHVELYTNFGPVPVLALYEGYYALLAHVLNEIAENETIA
jgi:hypothetical protein